MYRKIILLALLASSGLTGHSQRVYKNNSALAAGEWFKISVKEAGVYRIDVAFLNAMGVSTQNLSSSAIRLYGNGGQMLPEANAENRVDDLQENSIMVVDGGDGIFSGTDYFLFYAPGPDEWIKDSVNRRFSFRKNIYCDKSYYYLTLGGNGKRISSIINTFPPNVTVSAYNDRLVHELDTINFLASGKEWYGEEFSNLPGRSLSRNFDFTIPNIVINSDATLVTNCIVRSVGASGRFDVKINNQPLPAINVLPVGSSQYDLFAQQSISVATTAIAQNNISVNYRFVPNSFNAQGWLNRFEFFFRKNLSLNGVSQFLFRDWLSVANGNTGEFVLTGATAATMVWEITDPLNPVNIQGTLVNGNFRFINDCSRLREYAASTGNDFLKPVATGRLNNQDLHNTAPADYLIISYPALVSEANRLSQFHQQKNNLRVKVVTTEQVFNEFGSGCADPAAIRDFIKMYYDKYRLQPQNTLKYVLLFGDASYDYKDRLVNNTSFVPAYESNISLDPLATYTTDDFFGFLDDNEGINSGLITNLLDVGIGRVPAKNSTEAKNFVDKVLAYHDKKSFGPWRNQITVISDDEDQNLHFQDTESFSATINGTNPVFNINKIYLDAYKQQSGSGIDSYPQANDAVNNITNTGTLIWNYSGHGGFRRLAEEVILDQGIINKWNNSNRLPLFITATCDFAPYDNPLANSIGENLLLRPSTGAIALMTTTRLVFSFSNRLLNNNYLLTALLPGASNKYKTLGQAIMDTKNLTYQTSGDFINNRKFTLLGDPAMKLGMPELKIKPVKINGIAVSQTDTLSAMEIVTIDGEVTDAQGNILTGYNGTVYTSLFDKEQQTTTLANDPGSNAASFSVQNTVLFKGKNSATAGKFNLSFRVPKDINYQYGNGKISMYAENGKDEAAGFFTGFLIGGQLNNSQTDKTGPEIKAWLNDEKFVNGSITNQNPVLLVKLKDTSGINTTGTSVGHDIIAVLDNDNSRFFVLNDFFETDLNDYRQGAARFQLPELEPGSHTLKIRAWDSYNNSSELLLEFIVVKNEELIITRVLNYPNPFTTRTQFCFEHNRPGQNLRVKVDIYTLTGRIIKSLNHTINAQGTRSCEVEWDGRDEFGQKVGKGVYIFKLLVTSTNSQKKINLGKLVIF